MNSQTDTSELTDIHAFVAHVQKSSGSASKIVAVSELPDMNAHEEFFPETFYYIADSIAGSFIYFSKSVESIFGVDPVEALKMPAAEFMGQAVHPDDLLTILEMWNKFNLFAEKVPFEKLKDLQLMRCYRLKNKNGEYRKIVDRATIMEYGDNNVIVKCLSAISLAPLVSSFETATGLVLDISNGEQLENYNPKSEDARSLLTSREIQVLRLLAAGFKNKDVATKLGISLLTVQTHRKRLVKKLGIKSPMDIVWKALEFNLVGVADE